MEHFLAPNGKPSNLTPEQYKLVRTPEFKAWFGDWENYPENASKVVDENGEPMVVGRCDMKRMYNFGDKYPIFFALKIDVELFHEFGSKETYVFLNMRNPIIVDYGGVWHNIPYDSLLRSGFTENDLVNIINQEWYVNYKTLYESIEDTKDTEPYLLSTDIISNYVKNKM